MPVIKFDKEHQQEGWGFVFVHADDAYFRKEGVVFVKPEFLAELDKANIPYRIVDGAEADAVLQTMREELHGGKTRPRQKTLRSQARG